MKSPRIDFTKFFSYAEVCRNIRALARWKPRLTTIHKIGKSPGKRDILLLEINNPATGPSEDKPAYFVHGNIHAAEVSGATSALYLAHYLLANDRSDDQVKRLLDRIAFYICPRISVDGADTVLLQGRPVRSRETVQRRKNCIWPEDLNGDGRILTMRVPDPNGTMIAFEDDPRLLLKRLPGDDKGKRYRLTTEGLIHDWDGGAWSGPFTRSLDFNRNWGMNWKPPHVQTGAGRYGFSEPEMRAVGDFVLEHKNIFGMLGFHTGANAVLRPPSTGGDESIERADIAQFRRMGLLGSNITGFPIKPIQDYRNVFSRPADYWGHFPDWGYKALGLFVFEIELGTLYNSVGFKTEEIFRFTERDYRELERKMIAYRDAHPDEDIFVDWEPYDHPQLGRVEIGGWLPIGRANVVPAERVGVWDRSRQFIFELASRAPGLTLTEPKLDRLGKRLFRVDCRVANDGHLPTNVTQNGAKVSAGEGVIVEVERTGDVEFVAGRNFANIGHLPASGFRDLSWVVRTKGSKAASLTIVASAAHAGKAKAKVTLK